MDTMRYGRASFNPSFSTDTLRPADVEFLTKYRRSSDTCTQSQEHVDPFDRDDMQTLSVRSACTTPNSSRCLTPELPSITLSDSILHDSLSDDASTSSLDPSIRRSRLERMRCDVAKLGRLFHRSPSGSSKESLTSLATGSLVASPSRSCSPDSRQITVRYGASSLEGSMQSVHEYDSEWEYPDHNFSSSLVLTSLQEGHFSAEISLKHFPLENLVIFVSGHELEIVVDKHISDKRHKVVVPYHYGVVDLPIFVDTSSMVFAKDTCRNVLVLKGRTKGCFARRRSASMDTLPIHADGKENARAIWKKLLRKLGMRHAKSQGTIVAELKSDDQK